MFPFAHPKQLRRMAARMLLAWLFALAAGIVNACVVEPGGHQHALSTASHGPGLQGEHHGPAAAAASQDADSDDGSVASKAKANCVKFCGDQATGVPIVKPPTDPSAGTCIALPSAFQAEATLRDPRAEFGAPESPPPHGRIPILIAFRRLAL